MKRINIIIAIILLVVLIAVVCLVDKFTRTRLSDKVESPQEVVPKATNTKEREIDRRRSLVWKYHNQRNTQSAIQAAEEYLKLAPQDAEVWLLLAENYIWTDDLAEAERVTMEALKLNARHPWGLRILAVIFRTQADRFPQDKQKYLSKAQSRIEEAIDMDPDDAWIHQEAANVYSEQGKRKAALKAINKAIELDSKEKYFLELRKQILSMPVR